MFGRVNIVVEYAPVDVDARESIINTRYAEWSSADLLSIYFEISKANKAMYCLILSECVNLWKWNALIYVLVKMRQSRSDRNEVISSMLHGKLLWGREAFLS